jgi:hypothetical protein
MVEPLHSRRELVLRFLARRGGRVVGGRIEDGDLLLVEEVVALLKEEDHEERVQGGAVHVVHPPGGRGV